jgi:hypothetical protein
MTETTGFLKPADIRAKADAAFNQPKVEASEQPQPVNDAPQEIAQEQVTEAPQDGEVEQPIEQAAQPKPKTPYIPKPRVDEMVQKAREEGALTAKQEAEQLRQQNLAMAQYIQQNMQKAAPKSEPEIDTSKYLDDELAKEVFAIKKENEQLRNQLGQIVQTTSADKTFGRMEQIETAFAAQNPDYSQAVQHVIALYPSQDMGAKTVWDIATTALKENKNPAAELYAFAKKAGFAAKPAVIKNSPNLAAINRNADKARSIGDISSDVPTTDAPAYDYKKLVGRQGLSDPKKIRELATKIGNRAGNLV